jgi:hypothetical protein
MIAFFPSGHKLDFTEDRIGRVDLEELLELLALEHRFGNRSYVTVLQHSIAVGMAVESLYPGNVPLMQAAYTHDFHEAFLRDIPDPIKKRIGQSWSNLADEYQEKILKSLNVDSRLGDDDANLLKAVDSTMAFVEVMRVFPTEAVDYFKSRRTYEPDIVYACTKAFESIMSVPVWDAESLNPSILELYRRVLSASV